MFVSQSFHIWAGELSGLGFQHLIHLTPRNHCKPQEPKKRGGSLCGMDGAGGRDHDTAGENQSSAPWDSRVRKRVQGGNSIEREWGGGL